MRIARALLVLACTAALVTGCSDDSDEPSAAQKFCKEYRSFYEASSAGQGAGDASVVKRMKTFASSATKLDLPEEMPKDAQDGLKNWISFMEDLPDDATQQDAALLEAELSEQETKQIDAFYLYGNRACIGGSSSTPTE